MRWKLIDRITELEPGVRAEGILGVSFDAATLDRPDPELGLPRLLLLEAIADLVSWLVIATTDFAKRPLAASFDRATLGRTVGPGERVAVECELLKLNDDAGLIRGRARVDDEIVAELERGTCALVDLQELHDPEEIRAELAELRG